MKETWKFITLVVIAISVLLSYALIPEPVAENMSLKQIGLEVLAHESVESSHPEETDSVATEPTDTAAQRVLLFGDSMSEYLAYRLADYTNKNGHSLTCVTWCSSSTRNWAETDTLDHYLRKVNPTHVFICLGSNELYTADMKGCEKRIRTILAKIGKIPTVWIGPPNWCEDKGYNKLLLEVMGARAYYPSYKLSFERQADGRHPTMGASAIWMDRIIEWMNQGHSIHPFRMEKPDKKDRHYRQVTILPPGTKRKESAHAAASTDSTSVKEVLPADPGTATHGGAPAVAHKDSLNS